jgi:hypothetical protein
MDAPANLASFSHPNRGRATKPQPARFETVLTNAVVANRAGSSSSLIFRRFCAKRQINRGVEVPGRPRARRCDLLTESPLAVWKSGVCARAKACAVARGEFDDGGA